MFDKDWYLASMRGRCKGRLESDYLTERTALRCTKGQKLRWDAQARAEGISLSQWIANQCDAAFTSPVHTASET